MKCPGQDTQFWDRNAIFEAPCPKCGALVEFFKDDTTRKCRCGHRFVNPKMDFGCAAYCQFAEQCLGDLPPELAAQKEDLLKDRVAVAVKRYLKRDFKGIGRAARRARHAERICRAEQSNLAPVLMAAYLWELDAPAPDGRELPVARAILAELKAPDSLIETVCGLIARQGCDDESIEQRTVRDAARITDLEDRLKKDPAAKEAIERQIETDLQTRSGLEYVRELLLS
jgi:hypothetical protein